MATAITLALIVILIIVMPVFPRSHKWGYVPRGYVPSGLVAIFIAVTVFMAITVIMLWL